MNKKFFIGAGIIVAVTAVVFIILLSVSKPSTFEVKDGNFIIGGSFGITVPISGISGLEMTDNPPKIVTRT
jgi:hypothetical protein